MRSAAIVRFAVGCAFAEPVVSMASVSAPFELRRLLRHHDQEQCTKPFGHKARVLLVEDHPIVRQGLSLINEEDDLEVCGRRRTSRQGLAAVER